MQALKITKKYEKYPEYKDSGVEWLNNLPTIWESVPLRSVLYERREKNKDLVTDNILSVMKDIGVIRYEDKGDVGNKSSDNPSNYKIVYPNDIVVNSMNLKIGSVGISKELGVTSSIYIIYRKSGENVLPHFYNYVFMSKAFQRYAGRLGKGIMEIREAIKPIDLKSEVVPLPPVSEQEKIIKYLDDKTTLIDQIIEKKEKQIELLKEKRSTTITNTTTKGMNKSHKLVSSGSIWTSEVPEHWKIDRLSHYCLANDGGVWGEDDLDGRGQIVLRSTEITQNGSWRLEGAIKRRLSDSEFQKSKLFAGDLLLTKSSGSLDHLGKTAIVTKEIEEKGCAYSNFMQRLRLNKKFLPKYFFYLINNRIGREQIIYWGSTTSGLVNLNGSIVGRFVFPIPPVKEQEEIVNFLEKKLQKIDEATQKVENSIECLQEFKTSLISNVVTGKIKV